MRAVYVAGPYRAATAWQVHRNVNQAEEDGLRLVEIARTFDVDVLAVIPHTMTRNFDGTLTDQYWLDATQELLERCDAIFLGKHWLYSVGSRAERMRAEEIGMPIFDSEPGDAAWKWEYERWLRHGNS